MNRESERRKCLKLLYTVISPSENETMPMDTYFLIEFDTIQQNYFLTVLEYTPSRYCPKEDGFVDQID